MHRILLSFFFTSILFSTINAQSVTGTLHDASEKTPVSNATIQLSSSDSSASGFTSVSDSKGTFTFSHVPQGNYTLTASSVGYETYQK